MVTTVGFGVNLIHQRETASLTIQQVLAREFLFMKCSAGNNSALGPGWEAAS